MFLLVSLDLSSFDEMLYGEATHPQLSVCIELNVPQSSSKQAGCVDFTMSFPNTNNRIAENTTHGYLWGTHFYRCMLTCSLNWLRLNHHPVIIDRRVPILLNFQGTFRSSIFKQIFIHKWNFVYKLVWGRPIMYPTRSDRIRWQQENWTSQNGRHNSLLIFID